jgi:hypothetical protein
MICPMSDGSKNRPLSNKEERFVGWASSITPLHHGCDSGIDRKSKPNIQHFSRTAFCHIDLVLLRYWCLIAIHNGTQVQARDRYMGLHAIPFSVHHAGLYSPFFFLNNGEPLILAVMSSWSFLTRAKDEKSLIKKSLVVPQWVKPLLISHVNFGSSSLYI